MVSRIEVIPSEVRGYGNIVAPKTVDDFVPVDSELAYEDGVYTLGYDSGDISVSLTVSSGTITVGSSVTLTATVLEEEVAVSGGTVTFKDGSTTLGTGTTNSSGVATYTTSSLTVGTHSCTAVYDGKSSLAVTVTVEDVPVPVPDSITLTSDKSILSYADSQSATLSATVLDSSSNPLEGVTVTFYKGSTSLGTADTNSSGVATKSYSSAGVGDVSFTAEVGSLLSETYVVQDCDYYADTTKISNWSNVTSGNSSFKVSSYSVGLSNYSVEIKFNTINAQLMVGNQSNWVTGISLVSPYYFYSHSSNGNTQTDTISNTPVTSDVWRIEVEGTTLRLYRNNTLTFTKTSCKVDYPTNLRLYPQSNYSSVDYVKIKPL